MFAEHRQLMNNHDPSHILIVEDEPSVAHALEFVLKQTGYEVDVALDGDAAIKAINQDGYDLLVADLMLPDISGLEVIKKAKENDSVPESIVITGYPSSETAEESKKLGVWDYLRKPFSDDELLRSVDEALQHKQDLVNQSFYDTQEGQVIQKHEVMKVLNRAADERDFRLDLQKRGAEVLQSYFLSPDAKIALVSGDLSWINQNLGELTQKQLMFFYELPERRTW
jgi:DNA-binding response OmpR family regulator